MLKISAKINRDFSSKYEERMRQKVHDRALVGKKSPH